MIYLLDSRGVRYNPPWEDFAAVVGKITELLDDGADYVDQVSADDYTMRNRFTVLDRNDEGRPLTYVIETWNGNVEVVPNDRPVE